MLIDVFFLWAKEFWMSTQSHKRRKRLKHPNNNFLRRFFDFGCSQNTIHGYNANIPDGDTFKEINPNGLPCGFQADHSAFSEGIDISP
jgi:hypothetical protein